MLLLQKSFFMFLQYFLSGVAAIQIDTLAVARYTLAINIGKEQLTEGPVRKRSAGFPPFIIFHTDSSVREIRQLIYIFFFSFNKEHLNRY